MKNDENKIEKMVEDLAVSVAKGFDSQNKIFGSRFDNLESRFDNLESRFDNLENDNVWIKDILEKQSTTLARLDQERIFTFHYIERIEKEFGNEIKKIKKQLKIA